jgi:alpha-L-fucosidase
VIALELDGPPRAGEFRFHPDAGGMLTLGAESAKIETQFEQRAKLDNALGHVFLTQWSKPQDIPYWDIELPRAGKYQVAISYAATKPAIGSAYSVLDGAANLSAAVKNASGDWVFSEDSIGELELPAGKSQVKVKIAGKDGQNVMQLERVTLKPVR